MKKFIALLLALVMVLSMTACGSGSTTTAEVDESGTRTSLVYGMSAEPTTLDPMNIASMNVFTITYALYDTLTVSDGNGGYTPYLCDDIQVSEDGLTYTITLDKEVKFQDGSLLTPEDIVFSIERTIAAGWAADMTRYIESVEATDEHTVVMTLSSPFNGMMGSLASPFFSIMSKAYCEAHTDDELKRAPMGTGAYKLAEWVSGDHITLEANEDYFAGAPAIKTITLRPYTDKNTGLIALEAGEIDVFLNVNPSDITTVQSNEDLNFYSCDSAAVLSLDINVEDEILSNELVRKAIFSAINKDDIIAGALEGYGTPANSAIPTVCDGYSADTPGSTYDPEAAKEYLKEAGYEDGLSLTLSLKEDNTNQKVAQIIKSQLAEVGIDVTIDIMESGAWTTQVYTNGDYQLTIGAWYAMFLDAYSVMYSQFHKDCYGGTGNITHVTTDELSGLLDSAASASEDEKVAAYDAVSANILEHAYQLPLVYQETTITTTASLKGVEANPLGVYMLKDFYFE